MISDIEHFLMLLLAISMSTLENYLLLENYLFRFFFHL